MEEKKKDAELEVKEETSNEEVDNRSKLEKVSDGVENFFEDLDEAVYGDEPFDTAIPATIKRDSGSRKVVKWKTNANIQKKLFGGKKGAMVLFIILGIGGLCALFVYLVGLIIAM